ncbi:MAG: aminopeptidase P family protein [Streptosporangiales bacterium]|nr:aminopeptidase P family protein [Streptosporangiales bacterium]MBO0889782.1 aminopeptidase P family protein [Acidothermales bacterium]
MTFPAAEYEQRRANVRASMAEGQLDALVVTAPEDVYYLSGLNNQGHFVFTALVLDAGTDHATLVAREMEAPTAAVQSACPFVGYRDGDDPADVLADVLRPLGLGGRRIGHQPASLSFPVAVWQVLDRRLGSPAWVDCGGMLSDARAVRTDREIELLRHAGTLSDVGMRAGIEAASGTCSGGEIVGAMEQAMLSAGSDYPAFVPLVRPVDRIRQEHVAWTPDPITSDDTLFFELSAASARYHAPLGRTVRPRGRESGRAGELARTGIDAIVAGLVPGRTAEQVYREWAAAIEAGLSRRYERHHCGYLVGIGFPPSWMAGRVDSLRPGNEMTLRPGMTFHVQSWVLDEGIGTHATSDTALVTTDGAELLTTTPRGPTRPG